MSLKGLILSDINPLSAGDILYDFYRPFLK